LWALQATDVTRYQNERKARVMDAHSDQHIPVERTVIRLTARDSAILAEALLNPTEPNDALRAAAQRYRVLVESHEQPRQQPQAGSAR
jgi:hypothetical protein